MRETFTIYFGILKKYSNFKIYFLKYDTFKTIFKSKIYFVILIESSL